MWLTSLVLASFLQSPNPSKPLADSDIARTTVVNLVDGVDVPSAPLRIVYEGTFKLEAHLSKPHDVRTFGTRLTLLASGGEHTRLDWATWQEGHEDKSEVETTWLDGLRVLHRDDAKGPVMDVTGKHAARLRARVEAVAPWLTMRRIRANSARCTALDSIGFLWSERSEEGDFTRHFVWGGTSGRLLSVSRTFAHPRLGDAREEVTFAAWTDHGGFVVPESVKTTECEGDDALMSSPTSLDLHFAALESDVKITDELDLPAVVRPDLVPEVRDIDSIEVDDMEPGVVSFTSKSCDARTIVVEFRDHLVAIDAPLSSALGERIVGEIAKRYPSKPIRYVLFGHYHPHYTGGLRAFLAAGATVVAPESCAKFAAEIAARPFTIAPDALARVATKPKIESFRGARTFEDDTQRLDAIDIGAKSNHTDEYTVFHLPRTQTLIEDDIGWSSTSAGILSFGSRSRGLYEAIVEKKLDVRKLWQAWPATSRRPSITFDELSQGVKSKH